MGDEGSKIVPPAKVHGDTGVTGVAADVSDVEDAEAARDKRGAANDEARLPGSVEGGSVEAGMRS